MLATLDQQTEAFRQDVLAGLSAPIRAIPARWLYDQRGSELFDEITRLPAYYPTRTETALLEQVMPEIAALLPKGAAVVEFGAGSATKTPILLQGIKPAAYVPVDISRESVLDAARRLQRDYPRLRVRPVCADFTAPFDLPSTVLRNARRRVVYFPGSTLGNFDQPQAHGLLQSMRHIIGANGAVLIGIDLKKDPRVLERA